MLSELDLKFDLQCTTSEMIYPDVVSIQVCLWKTTPNLMQVVFASKLNFCIRLYKFLQIDHFYVIIL